jgi:hypothetical protein
MIPALFGAFWWIVECGHVLFNYKDSLDRHAEGLEEGWYWLHGKGKLASKLANDITLMNTQPPWQWDNPPPAEIFDVLGRLQTVFALIAVIVLAVALIGMPVPLGDAIKMIGEAAGVKEFARFGYRLLTGAMLGWYSIANVLGRKAITSSKPLSNLEKYYVSIHESYQQHNNDLVEVLKLNKHTYLFDCFQQLALEEKGTHWIVLLVLSIMSVTTLISNKPPKAPIPLPENDPDAICCDGEKPSDEEILKQEDADDSTPPEGLYSSAIKTNAKWSLQTGVEFVKQIFFPIAYVLIGVCTYGALMILMLASSNDWAQMTGKTYKAVAKDIWGAILFVLVALGFAMFLMNFLRYMEQFNSMSDYVIAHVIVVIIVFIVLSCM